MSITPRLNIVQMPNSNT